MKRKVALMLAAVMTTAMLPMNVMAATSVSVSKAYDYRNGDMLEDVYVTLSPNSSDSVESGAYVTITLENGKFYEETEGENTSCEVAYESDVEKGYDYYVNALNDYYNESKGLTAENITAALGNDINTSANLPYKIKYIDDHEIQVFLFPVHKSLVKNGNGLSKSSDVTYKIPIVCEVDGSTGEDVKIDITGNKKANLVSSYDDKVIANIVSKDGSTNTTVSDTISFQDGGKLEKLTIKENVYESFEPGEKVTVRLSGGFEIDEKKSDIVVKPGVAASFNDVAVTDINENKFTFIMPEYQIKGDTDPASIIIEGIYVIPKDEDDNWGDVSVTVSGAGITKQTVLVGTRADYGFKMSVTDEVPTILSGRTYVANDDLDEDDYKSATILFEETIADTWLTNRKLEFAVPEGVKIIDWEFDEFENMSDISTNASVAEEGTVLKIDLKDDADKIDNDEESSFELNLFFSIDADYVADIPVSVSGAGLAADVLDDVVVAQAIAPIAIETTSTKLNMGYQVYNTADVTITEAQDGVLLDGEEVIIAFDDAKYGNDELGFNDSDVEITVDGEVEVENFDVYKGALTFDIDSNSYSEPASITISGLTVGTTRSVPYGSYDLKVYGSAVVNNYDEDKAKDAKYPSGDWNDQNEIAYFDTTDAYSFADYLVILTEAGTLDGVVEVTIGEKTITVDGEAVDMDVAAYIQTASNSTMVPLRFVSIALGVDKENVTSVDESSKISWDAISKTATIFYAAGNGQKIIQFQAGSAYMTVDGTQIPMENGVVAEIVDGRMFVPFRALGTALGVSVSWDAETRTAIYNQK